MAFGDRIKALLGNMQNSGAGGGWYLGQNVGMQPGQAAKILAAGGPGAIALQFLLRDRGVPEEEIAAATQAPPQRQIIQRAAPDYTPLLIGGGILALVAIMARK